MKKKNKKDKGLSPEQEVIKKELDDKEKKALEAELLGDILEENGFDAWKQARAEILTYSEEEMEQIEQIIRIKILQVWKRVKQELLKGENPDAGFFRYADFIDMPEIKENFPIITTTGDRNIGKSTDAKRQLRRTVQDGYRFEILRNIQEEIKAQVVSDDEGFLGPCGWKNIASAKTPLIKNELKETVGWYRDINTIAKYKSIEFPKVRTVLWEEFNTDVAVSDKFNKFVTHITTVQRHNPELQIIIQANYVAQNDEWLQTLGIGMEELDVKNFVHFNWVMGAITIFIPKGIYKSVGDKKHNLGYRMSLGKYGVWKSQYGGGFNGETPINIINDNALSSIIPQFNIYHLTNLNPKAYGAYKMTLYSAWDKNGKMHNVLTTTKGSNNCPTFVFDYVNKIKYPNAMLMTMDKLEYLLDEWNNGNLKTTNMETHDRIIKLFAITMQLLEKQKFEIKGIENMVE